MMLIEWSTVPWGFRKLLGYIQNRYLEPNSIPLLITENGFPVDGESGFSVEQIINDVDRQAYFAEYIKELVDAIIHDGLQCSGYFGWSLLE
jgi:beta-glucosidase